MNEEEEESPLEGPRLRRNRLARERHAARSKEQCVADASRREGQRAHSAQRELDCANQGGNQVIPLARREFDGNHHGLRHTLGEMTTMYGKCDALHFLEEHVASSSCANPQFTPCCAQGKVALPPLAPPLEPLRWLLISNETDAKDFCQHIRSYNNALAFTFVGANLDTSVAQPDNYTYCLRGELYHRMGSLLP